VGQVRTHALQQTAPWFDPKSAASLDVARSVHHRQAGRARGQRDTRRKLREIARPEAARIDSEILAGIGSVPAAELRCRRRQVLLRDRPLWRVGHGFGLGPIAASTIGCYLSEDRSSNRHSNQEIDMSGISGSAFMGPSGGAGGTYFQDFSGWNEIPANLHVTQIAGAAR
jgi:hypothetical protein